jgi:DNA-binding CsgD family transcriptional regulator/tetratricopeptide (TPR) repeat protein
VIKKYLNISFLLFASIAFSQNLIDLNDSIRLYYRTSSDQKALTFVRQAIQTNSFKQDNLQSYYTNYLISEVLYFNGNFNESIEYLLNCLDIYEKLKIQDKRDLKEANPAWIFASIGNIYYQYKNFEKAASYWEQSTQLFKKSKEMTELQKIRGLNTIDVNYALISIEKENYDEAFDFYGKVLNRSVKNKLDNYDITYINQQFMNLHLKLDDEIEAKKYLNTISKIYSEELYKKQRNELSITSYYKTVLDYSSYLISNNKIEKALFELSKIEKDIRTNPELSLQFNFLISKCYLSSKKILKAELTLLENFKYSVFSPKQTLKTYNSLSEIYSLNSDLKKLLNTKDSIIRYQKLINDKKNNFNNTETLLDLDLKQRELIKNKIYYNNAVFFLILILILMAVITIIYRANFKFQNERSKRFKVENLKIENELSLKKRELFSKSNFILQRNDFLKSILDEIDKNKSENVISKIKKQVSKVIRSESLYEEFDKKFVEVFPDFYKKMNSNYNLSKTDIRLIAYIKMNKSNNEIAQISGISLRTVQSQRYRLAKKLKLEKFQDLNSFIFNI